MRFKILVFFLAAAFLGATLLAAYWFYENVDKPESQAREQLKKREKQARTGEGPDPGQAIYAKGVELVKSGDLEAAREEFTKLMRVYKDSARAADARQALGEMNMDALFSRNPMPGKRDYTVKPNDSLTKIEKGSLTTIPFLVRVNNLTNLTLQPGDRLVYQPLDFELELSLKAKRLTLNQRPPGGSAFQFFKDYAVTGLNMPPGYGKATETKIQEKTAFLGEKRVAPTDARYLQAKKWLQTTGRAGRLGLLFRPQSEREAAQASRKEGEEDVTYGVFLNDVDIEELNTVIRVGTPVRIVP